MTRAVITFILSVVLVTTVFDSLRVQHSTQFLFSQRTVGAGQVTEIVKRIIKKIRRSVPPTEIPAVEIPTIEIPNIPQVEIPVLQTI